MARAPKTAVRPIPEIQADIAAARARIGANVARLRDLPTSFYDRALVKGMRVGRGLFGWFRLRK